MFWKLFRLQALLDALFDDGWLRLGLPLDDGHREGQDAPLHQP